MFTQIRAMAGVTLLTLLVACSAPGNNPVASTDKIKLQEQQIQGLSGNGQLNQSNHSRAKQLRSDITQTVERFGGVDALPESEQLAVLDKQEQLLALYGATKKAASKKRRKCDNPGSRLSKC